MLRSVKFDADGAEHGFRFPFSALLELIGDTEGDLDEEIRKVYDQVADLRKCLPVLRVGLEAYREKHRPGDEPITAERAKQIVDDLNLPELQAMALQALHFALVDKELGEAAQDGEGDAGKPPAPGE